MGLTISVGYLAALKLELDPDELEEWKEPFDLLNDVLRQAGIAPHYEPETLPVEDRFEAQMIGYQGLHDVRRLAAHWSMTGRLPEPSLPGTDSAHDAMGEQVVHVLQRNRFRSRKRGWFGMSSSRELFAHLQLHSDAEGFYVPMDFEDVLFESPDAENSGLGGMVGSSIRLLAECEILARLIDLPRGIDPEDEQLWEVAETPAPSGPLWQRYGREAFGLARLITACQLSRDHKACVVFC